MPPKKLISALPAAIWEPTLSGAGWERRLAASASPRLRVRLFPIPYCLLPTAYCLIIHQTGRLCRRLPFPSQAQPFPFQAFLFLFPERLFPRL